MDILICILGSSIFNAKLSSTLGLPFVFAGHFSPVYLIILLSFIKKTFNLLNPYPCIVDIVNVVAANII